MDRRYQMYYLPRFRVDKKENEKKEEKMFHCLVSVDENEIYRGPATCISAAALTLTLSYRWQHPNMAAPDIQFCWIDLNKNFGKWLKCRPMFLCGSLQMMKFLQLMRGMGVHEV